ncbi:MAG: prephenate dehydrogenase, partial [Lysobacterales bacterium]
ATPVESIIKLLTSLNPYIRRGTIITDVGSAKTEIVEYAEKTLNQPNFFVGSHPLVGSEKKGVDNSSADLFTDSKCIITPTDKTHRGATEKIKKLWTGIGAKVSVLSPAEHDSILSYTSHLPHLLAFGLMKTVPKDCAPYVSGGLRDTTRIAASSAQMWNDICMSNSQNVIKALDEYVENLSELRHAIVESDRKKLIQHFTKAQERRNEFFS